MKPAQFETISPVDNSVYVTRSYATKEHIEHSLTLASKAQHKWRQASIEERIGYCERFLSYMESHADETGLELCWQMGRPIRYAKNEIAGLVERASYMMEIAPDSLKDTTLPEKKGFMRKIQHQPLGTVLVIAPWNYPYLTAVNAIIPALLAGNTVILKHSTQTPLVAERFAAAFAASGLPEGVFQILHLDHAQSEALMQQDIIRHVCFTGSVNGGTRVEKAVAGRFINTALELGGNDPAYVCGDADIAYAVETVIDGAMFNSGQSCCGIERAYVHASVYDEFIERARKLVESYVLGRPDQQATTLGPLVSTTAAESVRSQILQAQQLGAETLIDEKGFPESRTGTPYIAPQLLINTNHSMDIMGEETFGPALGIMKVRNDAEAIQLMNDSQYGLTAAIFATDLENAQRIGDQVETGTLFVNRCDYLDPALAWTGIKQSGKGCSLSSLAYGYLTRPKSVHIRELKKEL